jgi:glycosyltransferase involved in cell wall biosynthesis
MDTMKLSVVMPVYNEVNTIQEIVRRVVAAPVEVEKELIVVDDGSTDGTRERYESIREEHQDVRVEIVLHERNRGKGAALRSGFDRATGDIILVQDADLEYDPRDYPRLIAPIVEGNADVVYGSRFVGSEAHRVLYFWHMVGNRCLTLLSNAFTDLNLTDMETCYKVFRGDVLRKLKLRSNRFEIEPELTAKIARAGCRIFEVGISYAGRDYSAGKKITWRDGLKAVGAIVRYRFFD